MQCPNVMCIVKLVTKSKKNALGYYAKFQNFIEEFYNLFRGKFYTYNINLLFGQDFSGIHINLSCAF